MAEPAYPAARAVAVRVFEHFARYRQSPAFADSDLASLPTPDVIEAIINVAFWASLRREEGVAPKISLAFVSPGAAGLTLTFARPLPLTAAGLSRLAPAVERPGIHLGVWPSSSGELVVWGTTRHLPAVAFVLEVVTSGLLVIKHRGEAFGKFVNVAVLEGDDVKIVDEGAARAPECPGLVASLLGVELPGMAAASTNVLVQIAASMRAHRRGGALLVVPAGTSDWQESIVNPVLYELSPAFAELAALVRADESVRSSPDWQDDLRRAVDAAAGLTAVDGATVMTDQYELVAFGAKIMRRRGHPPVERMRLTEPVEGRQPYLVNPYQLGGTRHLSAAQFVQDQPRATALVASQDGHFTIFKWSAQDEIVRAHRVEALLL